MWSLSLRLTSPEGSVSVVQAQSHRRYRSLAGGSSGPGGLLQILFVKLGEDGTGAPSVVERRRGLFPLCLIVTARFGPLAASHMQALVLRRAHGCRHMPVHHNHGACMVAEGTKVAPRSLHAVPCMRTHTHGPSASTKPHLMHPPASTACCLTLSSPRVLLHCRCVTCRRLA